MIIIKTGVKFQEFTTGLLWILSRLNMLHKISEFCPAEIMITSVNDSTHLPTSKHYLNEAIDLRSHNFDATKKELFRKQLEDFLNIGSPCPFTVLLESIGTSNEHFHVQVRKGVRCQ